MEEKRLIHQSWIVGYVAMWAVRMAAGGWPRGLGEVVLGYFPRLIESEMRMWMHREHLENSVRSRLWGIPQVQAWARAPGALSASDEGFDVNLFLQRVVESTWAEGANAVSMKESPLVDQLCERLSKHCGETGANEGAVDTLDRILEGHRRAAAADSEREAMRVKAIQDAAWWGVFTSSLQGCAQYYAAPGSMPGYEAPAFLERAAVLADGAVKLAFERGVVPPGVAFPLEPAKLLEGSTQGSTVINIHGGPLSVDELMSELRKRTIIAPEATDTFNPNTGVVEAGVPAAKRSVEGLDEPRG